MAGAGPAVFRLVRFWSRRWTYATAADSRTPEPVQSVPVVEAVAASRGESEVTVADVAYQLGVDRSVASRLVSDAATHGYVRRDASPHDARRADIVLTPDGEALLEGAHAFQQRTFEDLVAEWPAEDRERLAGYLRRLADQVLPDPRERSATPSD